MAHPPERCYSPGIVSRIRRLPVFFIFAPALVAAIYLQFYLMTL